MFVVDKDGDFQFHAIAEDAKRYAQLPSGAYTVGRAMRGWFFKPLTIGVGDLVNLKTTVAREVRGEMLSFFDPDVRLRLKDAKVKNRRGIILYGPPGTGKTSLVRSLFPEMIAAGAVILVDVDPDYLEDHLLPAIHFSDPDRSVVLFFDEFDASARGSESELKSLLDGLKSPDHLLTIGCTNYLDRIPETLWKRPSRFSLVREMPAPDPEVRRAFLRRKFPMIPADVADDLITIIADQPLDFVHEVCALHLRGMDTDEIRDRIAGVKPAYLVMEKGDDDACAADSDEGDDDDSADDDA